MINYSAGKIYKLICDDGFYIGSTCRDLHVRLLEHKRHRTGANKTSVANLTINDNTRIELILNYPCFNRIQLEIKEAEIILANPDCINKIIPRENYNPHLPKNQPVLCEICNKILIQKSLSRHKKRIHPEEVFITG